MTYSTLILSLREEGGGGEGEGEGGEEGGWTESCER